MEQVKAYYDSVGATCQLWVMDPSADASSVDPMADYLLEQGYTRRRSDLLILLHAPASGLQSPADIRILPARAALEQTRRFMLAISPPEHITAGAYADAAMAHLDDPHWESLLALRGGVPVAHVGVLSVGDVGRIDQLHVADPHRRQGLGRLMLMRAFDICARSTFRQVMLACEADRQPAIRLFHALGFEKSADLIAYVAPQAVHQATP